MGDEKKEVQGRQVPEVKLNILATSHEVKRDLQNIFRGAMPIRGTIPQEDNWILNVAWADCSLSEFAKEYCKANLEKIPIVLDQKQTEKLWSYLALYWKAFVHNERKFFNSQHKAPDFAIVSAMFRETEWGAIGLLDETGIATRKLLASAINLLYYTRYADVVHAHFVVELQMIFATLRKEEEGQDEPPTRLSEEDEYIIQNNWLTFCNFLSLVSDIDNVQPDLSKQIKVLGDLRLMIQSLMKYVSFGLQYVYENVKKMPRGLDLCNFPNYHDPACYGPEKEFTRQRAISSHNLPAKPYLLTHNESSFRIERSESCTAEDLAAGLNQFAKIFVQPQFQTLLTYLNNHCIDFQNRDFHVGQVKPLRRMLQKAEDLKSETLTLENALLSLHDICRASFCFQLPEHLLETIAILQGKSAYRPLKHLEVIRIRNLFNESEQFLKDNHEDLSKKNGKNKNSKIWSEEGILHYRYVKVDVKIRLPESVTYIDPKGNKFSGNEFVGEIQLLMESYLYAKRETHRYWKLRRVRKSKELLDLPLWEHPRDEANRKDRAKEESKILDRRAALLRKSENSKECWEYIKSDASNYVKQLNADSSLPQGMRHIISASK